MKITLMILLASVAMLAGGCVTSHSHATDWEYKVVSGQLTLPLEQAINKAAAAALNLSATGGDMEGEVDLQWKPVAS